MVSFKCYGDLDICTTYYCGNIEGRNLNGLCEPLYINMD